MNATPTHHPQRRRTDTHRPGLEDVAIGLEMIRSMLDRVDRVRLRRLGPSRRQDLAARATVRRIEQQLADAVPREGDL